MSFPLVTALDGDGCEPGIYGQSVTGGAFEVVQRLRVCVVVLEGELVPERPESLLLFSGDEAALGCVSDASREALLEGAFDVIIGGVGSLGDFGQLLTEGLFVEGVNPGGLGGGLGQFLEAGLVGPTAALVVQLEEAGAGHRSGTGFSGIGGACVGALFCALLSGLPGELRRI